ncbi:MAG: hypothetical protein ACKO2L_09455 [Planctomycetaceae bacterium]
MSAASDVNASEFSRIFTQGAMHLCEFWVELLFAPAGYAQHRTLDLPGRACVVAIIGAILLMCALLIQ